MEVKRNDRRLVHGAVRVLWHEMGAYIFPDENPETNPLLPVYFALWIALTYDKDTDGEEEKRKVKDIHQKFIETGILPREVEDFFISIMVGEIQVHKKKMPKLKGGIE